MTSQHPGSGPVVDRAGRGEWTEPGAFEVATGVYRLPLPLPMDGLRAVNVYVVETDDGLVLIDGGWAIPASRKVFDSSLAILGYTVRDIRRFLVTHMHRDHYTQASVVGREVGAHVSLGLGDKATMDLLHSDWLNADPNAARLRSAGAEELAEGWRATMPADRPPMDDYGMPDQWLDRDLTIDLGTRRLDALSTPGHTQGHYVFADAESSLLFAGDHVLSTITPSIGFEPAYVQQPLRDYLVSLAKVRALPDMKLLPAHGPVTASSHTRIDELVQHHDVRLDQSLRAVESGARTAWEVAGKLPWTRHERTREELGPFDAVLAAFETLAHLELLALQDKVRRVDGETVGFEPLPETPA
ncbi:MAG: fold metallo-hydrolase [Marmoricola sp.]|nr:fold metallo-hydrolase [Marmoricola sp.]